jgi:hypothetical protein
LSNPIGGYILALESGLRSRITTEHSYRGALENLLDSLNHGKVKATNEPKRSDCGAPDFVLSLRVPHGLTTIGYLECKDVGTDLGPILRTDQLERYLSSLNQLILTDYVKFQWYVDGALRADATLGSVEPSGKLKSSRADQDKVLELLEQFAAQSPLKVATAKELAFRMARLTHMVRELVVKAFDRKVESAALKELRAVFAEALLPSFAEPEGLGQFADMFAQTLAYGLFAARVTHGIGAEEFRREDAAREIPKLNPLLRTFFHLLTGPELDDEPFAGFVDDLVQLLDQADIATILEGFGSRTRTEDPIVHFYETFLTAYDPKVRVDRGVYFTPLPLVHYLVRSVDQLLRTEFGCSDGLADHEKAEYVRRVEVEHEGATSIEETKVESHRVLILDPACGTGTFLFGVVELIRERMSATRNAGLWSGYVKADLLPRLFGFELLMAPYAIAHLKLGMQLAGLDLPARERKPWVVSLDGTERLGVFLTNALVPAERPLAGYFGPFSRVLTAEAEGAARVKRELPIMVIMGNPPFKGQSVNKGPWIQSLVRDYHEVDGGPVKEKNLKWLQDDYVKFIRFAEWRLTRSGRGIAAYVANNNFLDAATFSGMRYHLLKTFSSIYIINLRGSAKLPVKTFDGGKDESVFDIEQGVCLCIFVRSGESSGPAKVFYHDLRGDREAKYSWLEGSVVSATDWEALRPGTPEHLFVPYDSALQPEFESGWAVDKVFPVGSVGIVTARDELAVGWTEQELTERVKDFGALSETEAREKFGLGDDVRDWKVSFAQNDVKSHGFGAGQVVPLLYRPFDWRFTYYTGKTRGFLCMPRPEVMRNLVGHGRENIALITSRMTKGETFAHLAVTRTPSEAICLSPKTSNNGFVFPLYVYGPPVPDSTPAPQSGRKIRTKILVSDAAAAGTASRRANVAPGFIAELEKSIGLRYLPQGGGDLSQTFGPEDVFAYIVGILSTPSYRARYSIQLARSFPRIPITKYLDTFCRLVRAGEELISLLLLETGGDVSNIAFPVPGTGIVEQGYPRYVPAGKAQSPKGSGASSGRLYISGEGSDIGQFFEGVSLAVWEFKVGGYQVCRKWLGDRRGMKLSARDLTTFTRILVNVEKVLSITQTLDEGLSWPLP